MISEIGNNAGKVWKYLDKNGPSSFSAIMKGVKLTQREADRAIGWLARESKLLFAKDKNAEIISLIK